MAEHAWIFSGHSVRAIRAGLKTQTRRLMTASNVLVDGAAGRCRWWDELDLEHAWVDPGPSPAGNPGPYLKATRLSEDETVHRLYSRVWIGEPVSIKEALRLGESGWVYEADRASVQLPDGHEDVPAMLSWAHHRESSYCHARYMPKFARRERLGITAVRFERLQDISEEDAQAEGMLPFHEAYASLARDQPITRGPGRESFPAYLRPYAASYAVAWDTLNDQRAPWVSNPWVIAYTFSRATAERAIADGR